MSNLKDRALRAAERFVGHRGYDIVSTAYKLQDGGQIDIVAEDGDALVFIDVNARRDTNEGFPSDSITERTRERREKAAMQWFRSEGTGYRDRPIRFHNISLLVLGADRALIKHTINAMGCASCAPAEYEPEPALEPELACATA